jgi:HEAT repeat protein
MRALAFSLVLALGCSHRDAPGTSRDPVTGSGTPPQKPGGRMSDTDDLDTSDVQGIARKYRAQGLAVVDRVVAAMRSDDRPRVRANAVTVLLDVFYFHDQKDRARPYLLEALGDPAPDVVARAADGLAGLFFEDPAVKTAVAAHTKTLREATSSSDPIVQAHAVSALEKMGERPPAESMLRASNAAIRRRGIAQALATHDLNAVPTLADLARHDPELVVRMEAVPVAAALAAPAARDALLGKLVEDPADGVANAAIQAAGDTGAKALAAQITAILAQPEGNRTASAIGSLGSLGDAAAVPAIAAHLADRSTDAKWNAKLALDALVGPPRPLPDWQAWAQGKGYLPTNGAKPSR